MTTSASPHSSPDPADVASTLRLLAEATDQRSFFATLRRALPSLLPATRVDLLAPGGTSLRLVGDDPASAPADALRSATAYAEWLGARGYPAVSSVPLAAGGQHFGWLVFARQHDGTLGAPALALVGQLAALLALRLLYDQTRDDLALRDEHTLYLERRLHEYEEVRLRATLAVGAAHDIGNLFASIAGHAQLLQPTAPPALQHDLRAILQAAGDGHFLLRRMMAVRPPTTTSESTPVIAVPPLVQDALGLTRPFWEARKEIAIRTALGRTPPVRAYAAELREVLVNLIINAIGAMPNGGALTLRSFTADTRVVVEVSDTGRGIARDRQQAIFQPFTTTSEGGGGLGLSVSRAIVEGYGGTLTVRSAPGEGATFALAMPAARTREHTGEAQLKARTRAV
jgi:signal transduction histidine kinase